MQFFIYIHYNKTFKGDVRKFLTIKENFMKLLVDSARRQEVVINIYSQTALKHINKEHVEINSPI